MSPLYSSPVYKSNFMFFLTYLKQIINGNNKIKLKRIKQKSVENNTK